jgi:cation diffusion facilitator family transporter
MDPQRQKAAAAWLSVASNSTLIVLKLLVGAAIGSVSVISEAIHSGVDLLAAIIALVAVKTAGRPADREHPFGHGKAENLSGTIEAVLIFLAAGWIIYAAVMKLLHPSRLEALDWGVAVMAFSAAANWGVSRLLFDVGRRTESVALEADAWHLRTDVYTSLGVMAGLGAIRLSELVWSGQHFHWLDPLAAMVVAALIIRAAYHLTVKSALDLMDMKLPAEEEAWICNLLRGYLPTVRGVHRLRTRKAGSYRFIEFHIFVDSSMSVAKSHGLVHQISARIREHFPDASVTIHVEPCRGDCRQRCAEGCFLTEEERLTVRRGKKGLPESKPSHSIQRP